MTAQTLECEVLIVGGGPAGLSVAATLPDHVSTIIVHQDAEIGKPVRTSGGCWLDDVERLGIPSDFYQVMDPLDVYSDNKEAHFQVKDNKLVVLNITDLYQWIARKSDHKQRQLMLATKFLSTTKRKMVVIHPRSGRVTRKRHRLNQSILLMALASEMQCWMIWALKQTQIAQALVLNTSIQLERTRPIMQSCL